MKSRNRALALLGALALLAPLLSLAGCAAAREAARPEGRAVTVHVPAAESFDFSRRAEAPPSYIPPPFFEDDEYRNTGRWLTLFEMNYYSGPTLPAAHTREAR